MKMKAQISAIAVLFIGFLLVGLKPTKIPLDPYWRYQSVTLSAYIVETGTLGLTPFTEGPRLVEWVNTFSRDFVGPMIVAIISQITGTPPKIVQGWPLLVLPLFFSQLILAKVIVEPKVSRRQWAVVPIAALLTVANQFISLRLLDSVHRVIIGWILLFTIISYLVLLGKNNNDSPLHIIGLVILFISYISSYSTLVLSSLVLFVTMIIGERLLSVINPRHILNFKPAYIMIFIVALTTYFIMVHTFLGTAIGLFLFRASSIQDVSILSRFGGNIDVKTLQPLLLHSDTPMLMSFTQKVARLIDVGLVGGGYLASISLVKKGSWKELGVFEIILFGVMFQGIFNIIAQTLFAASGGINPFLLGMLMTPIIGTYSLLKLFGVVCRFDHSPGKIPVIIVLVFIIMAPPLAATFYSPYQSQTKLLSLSETDQSQLKWSVDNGANKKIISDFNTVSGYYYYGGRLESWRPTDSEGEYKDAILSTYYHNPGGMYSYGSMMYLVNDQMTNRGMFLLGSIPVRPSPQLDDKLNTDKHWLRIYTNGGDQTYVDTNRQSTKK